VTWRTPLAFVALCGAFLIALGAPTPASASPARPTAMVCADGTLVPELAVAESCALKGGVPPTRSWYTEVQEARAAARQPPAGAAWIVGAIAAFFVVALFGALVPKPGRRDEPPALPNRDALLFVPENWSRSAPAGPVFSARRSMP
jgi:hypothetical protein